MSQIKQILFPIDFSQRCIAAAHHLNLWAERFSAAVIALHIVDPTDYFVSANPDDQRVYEELAGLKAKRVSDLDYFCNHYLTNNNRVRKIVSTGATAELIVAASESEQADLVMLPRGHQSLGSRWMHDSVAAKVLDACTSPVWTSEKLNSLRVPPLQDIVCAVHVGADLLLDAANERLLDFVHLVAHGFGATVTCVYVAKSGAQREVPAISARLANIRHEMQDVAEFETHPGDIKKAIVEVANRRSADLIMLGRTRVGTVGLGVQGHILRVDHDAPCPVLSVL
jgi:nucleotide-binding universal stress UspA family protein